MGGCQNYGPFLGTLNIRCRIIIGIRLAQKIGTGCEYDTEEEAWDISYSLSSLKGYIGFRVYGLKSSNGDI